MDRDALRARVEEILSEQARFAPSAVGFGSGMGGMLPRRRGVSKSARRAPVTRKHTKAARGVPAGRRRMSGGFLGRMLPKEFKAAVAADQAQRQRRARVQYAGAALRIGGRMRVSPMKKLPRKKKVSGAAAAHAAMVKKVMAQNPGMPLGQASKLAKAMREGRA